MAAGVYYANCTAARAAGVAPLHRSDPGYRNGCPHSPECALPAGAGRDGDVVACELRGRGYWLTCRRSPGWMRHPSRY
ncbi:MAG: excalibur calcium-binding domain-containing protein, partial [Acidimicrobiales bacterium]